MNQITSSGQSALTDAYDVPLACGDLVCFVLGFRSPGKGKIVGIDMPDFPNSIMVESILMPGRREIIGARSCVKVG